MTRVFILHLLPLEYYPPVTNLLQVLDANDAVKTQVFSTHNPKNRKPFTALHSAIFRTVYPAYTKGLLLKLWAYWAYVCFPLWRLIWFKPHSLLYYEPHSAMPAYLYKRFFNPKVKLFIHYHEYYEPPDFNAPAMAMVRFFHKFEVSYLYKHAVWISQTNSERLSLFKKDYPFIKDKTLHTLANYPSKSWASKAPKARTNQSLKLLYIGALSFNNTYIKDLLEFVSKYSNVVTLDIYSYNVQTDVQIFIKSSGLPNINYFEGGIDYEKIPDIANNYDVGLILYNSHNLNYTYNAPNKLFEYLVCGLEVWLPEDLMGCRPYRNNHSRPRVKVVDFKTMNATVVYDYYKAQALPFTKVDFTCEHELHELINTLKT